MKHFRAKGILSVVVALLITAALAAVYGHIGLQTDINEQKQRCGQKVRGLTASIDGLKASLELIDDDFVSISHTNARLNAIPLRDAVQTQGDAAIGLYRHGCVVRVDGDRVITPRDPSVPELHIADFHDENGELMEEGACTWNKANHKQDIDSSSPEADEKGTLETYVFNRLHANYYYIDFDYSDFATEEFTLNFNNSHFNYSEIIADLEKIYDGSILIFQDDGEDHMLFEKSAWIDDDVTTMRDLGIDVDALERSEAGPSGESASVVRIGDKSFVMTLSDPVDGNDARGSVKTRVALLTPIDTLVLRRIPRLTIAVCISLLFLLTAVCWVMSSLRVFRREAITVQERRQYGVKRTRRTLVAIGIGGVLAVGLVTYFVNCLTQLYTATQNNLNLLEQIDAVGSRTQENARRAKALREEIYVNYAGRIADLLADYPRLRTRESLEKMCAITGTDYLMIYDDHGRELLSNAPFVNLTLPRDSQSPGYEFRLLLTGVPSVVQEVRVDELTRLERQLVGVSMDDGNIGDGYGALIMAILPDGRHGNRLTLDQLMQTMTPDDSLCLGLDPETGEIINASDTELIGKNALRLGMTQQDLQSGIMDHFTLNGQRWYSCTDNSDSLLFHSAVRADTIQRRLPITALAFSGCFLVAYALMGLALMLDYTDRNIDAHGPRVMEDDEALALLSNRSQDDLTGRFGAVMAHLYADYIGHTPERRTRFAFSFIVSVMLFGITAALQSSANGQDRFQIINYVLNGRWTPGINLFAIARIFLLIVITMTAIMMIRFLTGAVCPLLQKRGETILRLISSFVQYVSILWLLFAAFDCLGFDTRTLLASVGILTLAVSMGAKDLVSDVLSGITIAFADEYQIGEYIQINDFRGWVQQIGVRATTLVNNDGNIKHFSNRDVKNILNLSRRNCHYTINVTIAVDQSLVRVEEILKRELPRIGRETPEIVKGPEYKGIKGFTNGGVTLEIAAECKEQNYGRVRSKINREIRLLLEDNGIIIR